MTEDRTAGRQGFVKHVLDLESYEMSMTRTDEFDYQGDTYFITVMGTAQRERCTIGRVSTEEFYSLQVKPHESLEIGAVTVWDALESQRCRRLARIVNPNASCDGGNLSCKAMAVWAFRMRPEDGWMYACGHHLTWSMTEELGGEQGEITVRRIVTEGC